jgi:hypothetical protein
MTTSSRAACRPPRIGGAVRAAGCSALCAVLVLACGDASPDSASRSVRSPGRTPALAPDSASIAAPLAGSPTELASACLRGDPVEGAHWSLDGVAAPLLTLVRIEGLASRDSARLAARISAAVDVLPSDTSVADFRGLPVSVRAAWIVAVADGDSVVVALVARRIPIESAPLEELFAIIAAPGQRQGVRDPLIGGWIAREVGREEDLPARELVGAFRTGDALALVLAHDASIGSRAELVARRGGRWRTEWSGPISACGPDALAP